MSDEFNIEKMLPFLFCTQCGCNFDIECAKILATGNDTVIVKVVCKECGKKYALAFMDLTFPMFAQSIDEPAFDAKSTPDASESFDCSIKGKISSPFIWSIKKFKYLNIPKSKRFTVIPKIRTVFLLLFSIFFPIK